MYGAVPFAMPAWPPHLLPPGCEPLGGGHLGGHPVESSPILKLKGLPFSASENDVARFFEGFALLSASIHHGVDGRPSGMVRAPAGHVSAARRAGVR